MGLTPCGAHVTKAAVISKIPHKRPAQKTAGSSWGFSWFASLISWLFQQSETPGQTFRAWPAPYNTVYAGRLGWQNYPDPSLALPAGLVSDVSMLLLLVIPEQSAIDNDRCPGNIAGIRGREKCYIQLLSRPAVLNFRERQRENGISMQS